MDLREARRLNERILCYLAETPEEDSRSEETEKKRDRKDNGARSKVGESPVRVGGGWISESPFWSPKPSRPILFAQTAEFTLRVFTPNPRVNSHSFQQKTIMPLAVLKEEVEEPVLVGHVLDLGRIGSILSLSSSSNWLDRLRRHEDVHFVGPLQLVSYPSIQVTRLNSPPPWNQAFPSPDPPPSCSRSGRESL
ncbi:hypothetical protein YC2023_122518 [Brassica napus]